MPFFEHLFGNQSFVWAVSLFAITLTLEPQAARRALLPHVNVYNREVVWEQRKHFSVVLG